MDTSLSIRFIAIFFITTLHPQDITDQFYQTIGKAKRPEVLISYEETEKGKFIYIKKRFAGEIGLAEYSDTNTCEGRTHALWISKIEVHENFQNKGFGSELLGYLLKLATTKNLVTKLHAFPYKNPTPDNYQKLKRFYESRG